MTKEKEEQRKAIEYYLSEGISIFPLRYKDKRPISQWTEYTQRKITAEEIEVFFEKSQHNIGVIMGSASGNLFVLDMDSLGIFDKYFPKKEGLVYTSTGRGAHVYFRSESPVKTLKCFNDTGQEIMTLKGAGGYVVGAGSTHENGKKYKFVQQCKIPTLTGDVREHIKKRAIQIGLNLGNAEGREVIDIKELLLGVARGGQDNAIMLLSHYLRRQGESFENAFPILQKWNKKNTPIIPETEIREKLANHYNLPEAYKFFYKTNPVQYTITPDLELKSAIEIEPPMTIEEVFTEDEKGREQIDDEKLIAFIDSRLTFKCISDTQELLIYTNGIYTDEAGRLDAFLEEHLSVKASIHFKAEVRKHIKDRNQIERSEINADKTRMPVKNGLLNLNTHELEAFSKDRVYTTGLDIRYDPTATAPEFLNFISEILPAEEVPVVQEMFGYCLWRAYPAAKTFWCIGEGGNGKTVLTSVLATLLNSYQNVSHVPLNEMTGQHRFAGYELYSKLCNIVPEPTTSHALETPFLKAITGESLISVEKKGVQKRIHFVNFAKVIVEANSVPRIADEKAALWDRIIGIEFPYSFRGRENEKPEILKTLITSDSLSGVLNWALEGLGILRKNNWNFSTSIMQQNIKVSMQIRSNPIAAFKDNWLSFMRHGEVEASTVYDAYNLFGYLNDTEPLFKAVIAKELEKDNRIALHRVRRDARRPYVFQGCGLSLKIVCTYGWYQNRPLRLGEFDDLKEGAKVEIRTCNLGDYCEQYPEPAEEVQEVVGEKLLIFNTLGLVSLYKNQRKAGTIKHRGPQEVVTENDDLKKEDAPLFLKSISPLVEATCERCEKEAFLGHELTDEEGVKSLICGHCRKEIEEEIGKLAPPIFNTTLEERRASLKEAEAKGEKKKK